MKHIKGCSKFLGVLFVVDCTGGYGSFAAINNRWKNEEVGSVSSRKSYKIAYKGAGELRKFSFFISYSSKVGAYRSRGSRKERSFQGIFSLILTLFLGMSMDYSVGGKIWSLRNFRVTARVVLCTFNKSNFEPVSSGVLWRSWWCQFKGWIHCGVKRAFCWGFAITVEDGPRENGWCNDNCFGFMQIRMCRKSVFVCFSGVYCPKVNMIEHFFGRSSRRLHSLWECSTALGEIISPGSNCKDLDFNFQLQCRSFHISAGNNWCPFWKRVLHKVKTS